MLQPKKEGVEVNETKRADQIPRYRRRIEAIREKEKAWSLAKSDELDDKWNMYGSCCVQERAFCLRLAIRDTLLGKSSGIIFFKSLNNLFFTFSVIFSLIANDNLV